MNDKRIANIASVRETVWPWEKVNAAPAPAAPAFKQALVKTVVMAAVAALFFFFGKMHMGWVVTSIAGVLLVLSFAAPAAYKSVDAFFKRFGVWAGTGITWLVLTPFFYICFWPAALFLRMSRRDPMRLRFPASEPSCWREISVKTVEEPHKRQF